MKSLQADFFKVMKEGAIQYAAPLPFLDLVCVGTATQTEVKEQIDLMYSLIHQQVDAIVLVPIDSKALVQPAVEAVRKGIPVINIDIQLDAQLLEQAGVEVAFVGPDNFAAAYEVGKLLGKKLRNEDKVAMWMRYPDLKAVYCSNDAMALGVLQQMQEKKCYLPVVGFDNDAVMKEFLSTGKLVATADIFSSQMAVRGIEFALDVLEGRIENRGVHSTAYEIIKQ